ncbi:MarR family transcriptional regulator [Arcanobacterium haemolyticum]|nr:MarR family transcriptional regulator [Arcanobacterium haemolyticum]
MADSDHRLTPVEESAWRSFMRGSLLLFHALNRDLVDAANITLNDYEILALLSESPENSLRMSTIADSVVHSRSRLTHTVRRLETRGFVRRTTDPLDRRGVNCELTPKGAQILRNCEPVHVSSVRRHLIDKLGHEQVGELNVIFAELLKENAASLPDSDAAHGKGANVRADDDSSPSPR